MTKLTLKSTLSADMQAKLNALKQEVKKAEEVKKTSPLKKDYKGQLLKIRETQAWLCKTWPLLFHLNEPKPLKPQIEKDLFAHSDQPFSHVQIRKALHAYTQSRPYLKAVLTNPQRYNLNGQAVAEVLEHEREYSQAQLDIQEQRLKAWQAKRHKKLSQQSEDKAVDKAS